MSGPASPADYPLLLWPAAASNAATHVDYLISAFTAVTLLLTVPIFLAITWFALVYRASRKVDRGNPTDRNVVVEMSWMLIPFFLTLGFFAWGAQLFDVAKHPPANAMTIQGIGRQWMWKFQHPGGQAEINDLHVPTGQPVVINMISQDVIHSLYLPAFRVQMETLARPIHASLVHRRPAWRLPAVLLGILRDRPFGYGWRDLRYEAGRLRALAQPGRINAVLGGKRQTVVRQLRLHGMPRRCGNGARAVPCRAV